jgi:hypothetical protein
VKRGGRAEFELCVCVQVLWMCLYLHACEISQNRLDRESPPKQAENNLYLFAGGGEIVAQGFFVF